MKNVTPSPRFEQEIKAQGFNDVEALCKDISLHLSYDDDLSVQYLGRVASLAYPTDAEDAGLGHIHLWDPSSPWFDSAKQGKWNRARRQFDRTSDTCIVYSSHWENEDEILLLGVANPCHTDKAKGKFSKLFDNNFMEYFLEEGLKFNDL
ncbi:type II toxin-antitoxin system YafO family toxin [Vibrio sp. 10N.222.51.E8]|uniref:type II toxin-antitoxin system YafO family toxin n=1 Tax=unclassified Vibrio TaxID=2614977 RepID=UPI00354BBDEF